jgi:methylase of polypeptide subunit release factors
MSSNEPQIKYWSTGPGSKWVENQPGLDACFNNINHRLMDIVDPASGDKILDVGCGTGATSIALLERQPDILEVTGLDVSIQLLALAKSRIDRLGLKISNS